MPFTVSDFHDLVRLLEEHPDWQTDLRRVLFSQDLLELPRTVQELATAQRRTEEALARLTERLEQGFAEATAERREIRQDLAAAATDRQRIWERLEQGFAEAAAERLEMRQDLAAAATDRHRIWERLEQGFAEAAAERLEMRQDLAEAATDRQRIWEHLEQGFAEAAADRHRIWERLEQGFAEAAADRHRIWERLEQGFAEAAAERLEIRRELATVAAEQREMRQDLGRLKGMGQEHFYRDRAAAIFGRLLLQGHDVTNQVADQLQEAHRAGLISNQEYQEVLAADLLWGGQVRDNRQAIVLVLEASWTVGITDIERAASRAAVLTRAGLEALPVAAGQEWPPHVQAEAISAGVAMVQDGVVDQASWETALAGS